MHHLQVIDALPQLCAQRMARLAQLIEVAPRAATHKDWRRMVAAAVRHLFSDRVWIYYGGSHIAIHSSPPAVGRALSKWAKPEDDPEHGQAGQCLFRIIEVQAKAA